MRNSSDHIVHSLLYEVQFNHGSTADAQNILNQFHQDNLRPVFQKVFDQAAGDEACIQINTCELDLGIIPLDDWKHVFMGRLENILEEKLSERISESWSEKSGIDYRKSYGKSPDILILTKEQQEETMFLFFLERGYLKWNTHKPSEISVNQLFTKIILRNSEEFRKQLPALFERSENTLERFLIQIESGLILKWLDGFAPQATDTFNDIQNISGSELFIHTGISENDANSFRLWLKKRWIEYLIGNEGDSGSLKNFMDQHKAEIGSVIKIHQERRGGKRDLELSEKSTNPVLKTMVEILSAELKERDVHETDKYKRHVGEDKKSPDTGKKEKPESRGEDSQKMHEAWSIPESKKDETDIVKDLSSSRDREQKESNQVSGEEKQINNVDNELETELQSLLSEPDSADDADDELVSGILAVNAGLILLWPYLKTLFESLELLKNHHFTNRKKWIRSMFVLHYLATGRMHAEEHELLIPKIMTGFKLNRLTPVNQHLGKATIHECTNLLKAAIQNWPVLKSTSPDGFRQTFLQREALVKKKADEWHFMFERKGVDVLLDQLPYGLTFIKFRWLNTPIQVIW